jgi:hypothetical protein
MTTRIIGILLFLAAAGVQAQDYLPLETGRFWSYVADDGVKEMKVVGERVTVFGTEVFPIEHPVSDANAGLENYWSKGPGGEVLLWGFFREGWGYLYQPPIAVVAPPLLVGRTWTATFDLYALPDTSFAGTYTIMFEVCEDPVLTLPAGEFATFGIGEAAPAPAGAIVAGYTLWGAVRGAKTASASKWYAADVGEVQYATDRLYRLESWTDEPIHAEPVAWGAVKALYRGD